MTILYALLSFPLGFWLWSKLSSYLSKSTIPVNQDLVAYQVFFAVNIVGLAVILLGNVSWKQKLLHFAVMLAISIIAFVINGIFRSKFYL